MSDDDSRAISFLAGIPTTMIRLAWRQGIASLDPPKDPKDPNEARRLTCGLTGATGFSSRRDKRSKFFIKLKELEPARWRRSVIQMMRHLTGLLKVNRTCLGAASSLCFLSGPQKSNEDGIKD